MEFVGSIVVQSWSLAVGLSRERGVGISATPQRAVGGMAGEGEGGNCDF